MRTCARAILNVIMEVPHSDLRVLKRLSSPSKIQDFLDTFAINHERGGETCMSPLQVLRKKKAHCLEGALLAAAALALHGEKPLLMNLKAAPGDDDHAVALYRVNGYWGAISKTNHASLRFRDPVYKTLRELALSYFHEYFVNRSGKKTLRSYSRPFDLSRFGTDWMTSEKDLWKIAFALRASKHANLYPKESQRYLRPADPMERRAGRLIEWKKSDSRT